jgi:hypothetical protein
VTLLPVCKNSMNISIFKLSALPSELSWKMTNRFLQKIPGRSGMDSRKASLLQGIRVISIFLGPITITRELFLSSTLAGP